MNENTAGKKPLATRSTDVYLDDFIYDSQMKWRSAGYRWTSLEKDELGLDFFEDVLIEMEDFEPDQDLSTCFIVWKPVESLSRVDPLLTTQWSVGLPFCLVMKSYNSLSDLSVAMAQIMNYRKRPIDIKWSRLKDRYVDTDTIPEDFANKLRVLHKRTNFDINKYNLDSAMYVGAYMMRENGFLMANPVKHSINTVLSSLKNNSPVIGGGISNYNDGSVWIYDGMIVYYATYYYYLLIPRKNPQTSDYFKYVWDERELRQDMTTGYTHIHINWGMGGYHDGWFLDSNPHYTNGWGNTINFTKAKKDIINL